MPVATSQILQKQQSKLPTSMRYERVQDILEKDAALGPMLSPKSQCIDSRFGEKIHFSKEAIAVTEAIHAEGKDAHKVPKNEVLRVAMRVMKFMPGNGEARPLVPPTPATLQPPPAPAQPAIPPAKKKSVARQKPAPAETDTPKPQEPPKAKKKPEQKKPVTAEQPKTTATTKGQKPTRPKPESPKEQPEAAPVQESAAAEETVPESELPPEKQPLRLPAAFDSSKWPHYDVQNSVYCLLLSALNLSEHFEKFPGFEERQRKLELLLKDYLATCDAIKMAS